MHFLHEDWFRMPLHGKSRRHHRAALRILGEAKARQTDHGLSYKASSAQPRGNAATGR